MYILKACTLFGLSELTVNSYVVYLVMAATAVQESRKSEQGGADDDEEQGPGNRHPMACVVAPDRRHLLPL